MFTVLIVFTIPIVHVPTLSDFLLTFLSFLVVPF